MKSDQDSQINLYGFVFQTNVVCLKVNVNDVINEWPVSMPFNNLVFVRGEGYSQTKNLKTSNGYIQYNDQNERGQRYKD